MITHSNDATVFDSLPTFPKYTLFNFITFLFASFYHFTVVYCVLVCNAYGVELSTLPPYRLKWLQKLYTMEPRLTVTSLVTSPHHYACPVWERSTHAKKLDVTLNETFMKLYLNLNVLLTRFAFFWRVAFSWHLPVFFSSDFE